MTSPSEQRPSKPLSRLEAERMLNDFVVADQRASFSRMAQRRERRAQANEMRNVILDLMVRATTEPKTERVFVGVGELERTGYIPEGSANERERAAEPPEAAPEELTERLLAEADLCRNDGATDIAKLLEDAAKQNEVHWRTRRTLLLQLQSTAEPPSAAINELLSYGGHRYVCDYVERGAKCSCGWQELSARVRAGLTKSAVAESTRPEKRYLCWDGKGRTKAETKAEDL